MFIGVLIKFIEPYIKNIWKLEIGFSGRKHRGRIAVGRGRVVEKEIRDELLLMHGIRVAIIHEIFLLSVRIPKFSDQVGTSGDEIIAKLIRFDVLDAVEILRKIFPTGKNKNL